jgi:hypothetical protein
MLVMGHQKSVVAVGAVGTEAMLAVVTAHG